MTTLACLTSPFWSELGPAQPQLVTIFLWYTTYNFWTQESIFVFPCTDMLSWTAFYVLITQELLWIVINLLHMSVTQHPPLIENCEKCAPAPHGHMPTESHILPHTQCQNIPGLSDPDFPRGWTYAYPSPCVRHQVTWHHKYWWESVPPVVSLILTPV